VSRQLDSGDGQVSPSRRYVVVDAPSNLGLRPPAPGKEPGVRGLAGALRAHGLVARLDARDGGGVQPAAYAFDLDPAVGIRNWAGVRQIAFALADHLKPLFEAGERPVVLGGDCSILLGPMLAIRQRGRFGLVFIDGHDDLLLPGTSRTGGAAGMDLALVLGLGPDVLSNLRGAGPLARPEDGAVLGVRSGWTSDPAMAALRTERIGAALSLAELRALGMSAAAERTLAVVTKPEVEGFWVHLDADVLDNAIMPAVDSPQPGGLSYGELIAILRRLLASDRFAGISITIYDPDLDPAGTIAAAFVGALVAALRPDTAGERASQHAPRFT
jgi:arginase